jgi:hypothetical protein
MVLRTTFQKNYRQLGQNVNLSYPAVMTTASELAIPGLGLLGSSLRIIPVYLTAVGDLERVD